MAKRTDTFAADSLLGTSRSNIEVLDFSGAGGQAVVQDQPTVAGPPSTTNTLHIKCSLLNPSCLNLGGAAMEKFRTIRNSALSAAAIVVIALLCYSPPSVATHYGVVTAAELKTLAKDQNVVILTAPFRGASLYIPKDGLSKHSRIVALEGSAGASSGFTDYFAIFVAARGFAVLVLDYYHAPGLPANIENIPVELVWNGGKWLTRSGHIRGKPMLMGSSFGAAFSLTVGGLDRGRIFSVIAAYAPLATYPQGHIPPFSFSAKPAFTFNKVGLPPNTPIPLRQFPGPVLLVHGTRDEIWAYSNSTRLVSGAKARGKKNITLKTLTNATHFFDETSWGSTFNAMVAFFKKTSRNF
ncbi:MAG: hypothetical protein EXR86_12835 [Gammaproteobacteria bacterium]|nr:hypothetical protein [Gammaproteobacteria bacterium]